ncbi:MAG: DUF72 domain-containing protein [Phycisphaerae bacterium]|nr:DUF72 domain-containing protein [Phycisphaerae bacterium]
MGSEDPAKLWIGPSGWSYDDWNGVVYPQPRPRGFKPLTLIGRLFNAVEVNSSFYRIPTARMTAAWPRLVPPDFRFAVKLNQAFTHQRAAFPDQRTVADFREGTMPLRDAGMLGPLLIQFPWSFRHNPESVDWLGRLRDAFGDYERFVEVRHQSWAEPQALDALRNVGGYCNIDQPRLRDCLGPTQHVFGHAAYLRLHGRNARNWFAEGIPPFERYNYLYSDAEIAEWITRLREMAKQAGEVFVFANNHYRGQGVVNALELRALYEECKVAVPDELRAAYPRLAAVAQPPRAPRLFE